MGILNSLRQLKKWFTDKTGITGSKESLKRKNNECESTSNNKRMRMDDSLVEVVEISDESLSEAEEAEIIEPGPSNVPLRASPPVMLDGRHQQRRVMSIIDLTESSDEENKINVVSPYDVSNQPYTFNRTASMGKSANIKCSLEDKNSLTSSIKGPRNLNMEYGFSALQISDSSVDDSNSKTLAHIVKHLVLPKLETGETSASCSRSIHREHDLTPTNLSQTSDKENVGVRELSFHKNKIIKHEMFYDRILKKFRETKAAMSLASSRIQHKSPDEIFNEKLEVMNEELNKITLPIKQIEVFPGYTNEVLKFIHHQMNKPNSEFVTKGKNIKINDLKSVFLPTAWLNDEVINHYMNLIASRDQDAIHTFDTFFYTKLSVHGYQSVRRWSRKKDIFACKKMFTPIHLGNHWCLVCVNFVDKTVTYYDSLEGTNPKCLDVIFDYLKKEYENKKDIKLDCSGWRLMNAKDCPIQKNGFDCGVFTCINAEYLSRDAKLDFTQEDMPKLRLRICYEILKNRLCH